MSRTRRVNLKTERTPDQLAELRAERERFTRERPTLEQLVATGDYEQPVPHGHYVALRRALADLRLERERQGLSLADVAERSGLDRSLISRLETGRQTNPTVATLARYAAALGLEFSWTYKPA